MHEREYKNRGQNLKTGPPSAFESGPFSLLIIIFFIFLINEQINLKKKEKGRR